MVHFWYASNGYISDLPSITNIDHFVVEVNIPLTDLAMMRPRRLKSRTLPTPPLSRRNIPIQFNPSLSCRQLSLRSPVFRHTARIDRTSPIITDPYTSYQHIELPCLGLGEWARFEKQKQELR